MGHNRQCIIVVCVLNVDDFHPASVLMAVRTFLIFSTVFFAFAHRLRGDGTPPVTLARFGEEEQLSFAEQKFLLYDVVWGHLPHLLPVPAISDALKEPGDVYMRVANAVRQLRERGHDFILVLPPWGNIWHWRQRDVSIPWKELFDLHSLATFVPVMEFTEFLERNGQAFDLVLYLQHYAEGWSEKEGFLSKFHVRPCLDGANKYYKRNGSKWEKPFVGHKIQTDNFECLSIQGQSSTLVDAIIELLPPNSRSIMVDRAETILHDNFGDVYYWRARKSMRYSDSLRLISDKFRQEKFASKKEPGNVRASDNYLCVHLRRADFVWAHREDVPSLEWAAEQLEKLADVHNLKTLFLSTDTKLDEVERLKRILTQNGLRIERFDADQHPELSEAAISIIDQWICAQARYFIGTHHSTFSLRIHEDRELLGFQPNSTFNRLCPDGQSECEQPARWTIVHKE